MVFGVPQSVRYPFQKPSQASANWRPPVPMTKATMVSRNFHPFSNVSTSGMPTYEPHTFINPGRMIGPAPRPTPPPPAPAPMGAANMMRGVRGFNPYDVMKSGRFPQVAGSAADVKRGVNDAQAIVRRLKP